MRLLFLAGICLLAAIQNKAQAQTAADSSYTPTGCWLGQIDIEGVAGQLIFFEGDQLLLRLKAQDRRGTVVQEYRGHFKLQADTLLLTLDTKERYTEAAARRKVETVEPRVQHLVRIQNILSGTFILGDLKYPATFYEGCD